MKKLRIIVRISDIIGNKMTVSEATLKRFNPKNGLIYCNSAKFTKIVVIIIKAKNAHLTILLYFCGILK